MCGSDGNDGANDVMDGCTGPVNTDSGVELECGGGGVSSRRGGLVCGGGTVGCHGTEVTVHIHESEHVKL